VYFLIDAVVSKDADVYEYEYLNTGWGKKLGSRKKKNPFTPPKEKQRISQKPFGE
jgi:hypothetical protein